MAASPYHELTVVEATATSFLNFLPTDRIDFMIMLDNVVDHQPAARAFFR